MNHGRYVSKLAGRLREIKITDQVAKTLNESVTLREDKINDSVGEFFV